MKQANTTSEEELREQVDALLDDYFRPHHDYIYNAHCTNGFLDAAIHLIQQEVEKAKVEARLEEHIMVRDKWASPGIADSKTTWSLERIEQLSKLQEEQ